MKRRAWRYRKHWDQLIDLYGRLCFYCREEVAVCIDHVVPWEYDQDNSIENLVPACTLCNVIASDKHFELVEEKRQYILKKRSRKGSRRSICTDCFLPFTYRQHSPSLFLCAECYDDEYETKKAKTRRWQYWLTELKNAEIIVEAHRELRANLYRYKANDRKGRLEFLTDAYDKYYNK